MAGALYSQYQAAHDAVTLGDWKGAAHLYRKIFEQVEEQTDRQKALKGIVAYEAGFCLLMLNSMLDVPLRRLGAEQLQVATEVRALWLEHMRLFNSLNEDNEAFVDEQLAQHARKVIRNAPVMRGEHLYYHGKDLVEREQNEEAVNAFTESLQYLDLRVPDHWQLIRTARRWLAPICSDMGRLEEASLHAEWVLKNEGELDETTRIIMCVILGQDTSTILQSSSKKCFIATAAYASPSADQVLILRTFRDKCLIPHKLGRHVICVYERMSPRIAGFIAPHPHFRAAVRLLLTPIVRCARYMLRADDTLTSLRLE